MTTMLDAKPRLVFASVSTIVMTFALILSYAPSTPVLAGKGVWTSLGALPSGSPTQPKVFSFAVDPSDASVLYAGPSAGGLFKSTDGGATWPQLTNGLPANEFGNFRVTAIGLGPNSANVVFIGSNRGIFRSTDAGGSWSDVTDGVFAGDTLNAIKTTNAVAVSPAFAVDKTVFIGTSFGRGSGRVFRTSDAGATWQIVGAEIIASTVLDVAISPSYAQDRTVFSVDFVAPPVKRSTDGGKTWEALPLNAGVQALRISPNFANDRTVFSVGTSGINKSTDGGMNWTNSTTEPNQTSQAKPVTAVAISPTFATDQAVFASVRDEGVFQSFGGVAPWTPINQGLTDLVVVGLRMSDRTLVLNAESTGLWAFTPTQPIVLPSTPVPPPAIPSSDIVYFPETRHNLAFGFKYFWDHNGGLARFGFPRTEEFQEVNPADGKTYTVQYFERARFEYHPEFKGTPFEVELGLLGRQVTAGRENEAPFQPILAFTEFPENRFFPETGHSLAFGFKSFWENNGGLAIYGFPISEEFLEVSPTDGVTRVVQYFERVRFEYHPELKGTPFEVQQGLLGDQVLRARGWIS